MSETTGRLAGRVAIVTGAGSSGPGVGTGRASAICLAREGARVLAVDRDAERAEETSGRIRSEGGEAAAFAADVTDTAACEAAVAAVRVRWGRLDVLVNNVGVGSAGDALAVEDADWSRVLDVNLTGMLRFARAALPALVDAGGGSIVNVSSIEALRASSAMPVLAYAASKGGVISMTRAMAVHHGRQGVRVNCIVPGFLDTPMVAAAMNESTREVLRRATPLGSIGDAWDVARAAVFLASDDARWITGAVLPVDGGILATTSLTMLPQLLAAPAG